MKIDKIYNGGEIDRCRAGRRGTAEEEIAGAPVRSDALQERQCRANAVALMSFQLWRGEEGIDGDDFLEEDVHGPKDVAEDGRQDDDCLALLAQLQEDRLTLSASLEDNDKAEIGRAKVGT